MVEYSFLIGSMYSDELTYLFTLTSYFKTSCFLKNIYNSDLTLAKTSSTGSGKPLEGSTLVRLDRQVLQLLYRRSPREDSISTNVQRKKYQNPFPQTSTD